MIIITGFEYKVEARIMRMNRENGFTLLEIIITLFLMTLILGLSAIYFANRLPSARFNATTREIVATLRHAWSLARINNERQTVTVDLDSKTYGINGFAVRNIPPDVNIKIMDSLSGEVNHGKYQLVFQTVGGAEGGMLVLWNSKKMQSIQLDPVIGAAVVKQ